MSDASYIYAEINAANDKIEQCKKKIEDYKKKKEKLKKAKAILKESKSDLSDEKKNAKKTLRDFKDWKGSNYDKHDDKVQGDLMEGYTIYSNTLNENIGEINDAISKLDNKIEDQNDMISQLNSQIISLYDALARLAEEEEEE